MFKALKLKSILGVFLTTFAIFNFNTKSSLKALPLPLGFSFKPYIGIDANNMVDHGSISNQNQFSTNNISNNLGAHIGLRVHNRLGFEFGYSKIDANWTNSTNNYDFSAKYKYYDVRLYQSLIDLSLMRLEGFLTIGGADFSHYSYKADSISAGDDNILNGNKFKIGGGLQFNLLGFSSLTISYENIASNINVVKLGLNIYFF